jgi:aspartate/methionine/tyrosine aminotransferase
VVNQFFAPAIRAVQYPWDGLLAQAAEAKGSKLNATLGVFLDDDLKIGIVPAVSSAVNLDRSRITEYAPSHGVGALRQLWRQRLLDADHIHEDMAERVSLPIVTAGLTAGLTLAGHLFLEPGRGEIIIADPYWPNYDLMFKDIQHCTIRTFQLFDSAATRPEDRTKANLPGFIEVLRSSGNSVAAGLPLVVLLNLPHNPTGYSFTNQEADHFVHALREYLDINPERRVVVLIDDAYSGFVFEPGVRTHSLMRDLGGLHDRLLAVHISGATKELYAWGLRVGFVTFAGKSCSPKDLKTLEDKAAAIIRGTLSNVSMLSQQLTIETLKSTETETTHLGYQTSMQARYAACKAEVALPEFQEYFQALPFNSGYFFALRIRDSRIKSEDLRKALLEEHSVGVVTIGPELVRIAFSAITAQQVPQLFQALAKTIRQLLKKAC